MTESNTSKTPTERIAEIEKRREERRAKYCAARDEQEADDMEAIDEIECQRGPQGFHTVKFPDGWQPGIPTTVAFRTPTAAEVKRFASGGKNTDDIDAVWKSSEQLCRAILLYPSQEVFTQMLAKFPNLHGTMAVAACDASAGESSAKKKR